jgi:hypothetical protein
MIEIESRWKGVPATRKWPARAADKKATIGTDNVTGSGRGQKASGARAIMCDGLGES